MKTAIQDMVEFIEQRFNNPQETEVFKKATELLEKEKKHIIDFGYKCRDNQKKLPQDIFNQTYNQNK